ncbi:hypothetical protein Q0590_15355 [Rhodocytophaga aerolata]|uniref:YozE SAM-like domain-containing protein n=1 Tax=Rhodocytophaga aerolata TaxID=455078 RepID=A0ABT8R6B8_9BACT|nr:hypothetical protein [Rhodocytophaga aerolata]MDO1447646.1 hypothetical protein [Rhodocytophaga aerolata]
MEKKSNKSRNRFAQPEGLSYKEIINDYYCWQQEEADTCEPTRMFSQAVAGESEFGEAEILEDIYKRLLENTNHKRRE